MAFWKKNGIFEKTLQQTQKAKPFVFFEGPPTANGRPGIHHFLGRAFKDLFCRYKTMRGFYVLRKAGWDTHGLPVEIEVEKELGFTNKKQIEEYGIASFNRKARESVWKYKKDWENMTERMGFWLDMDQPYVTYENRYMESVWAILKEIWNRGLIYKAHKVVPYCPRCGTPLSSHEVAQGYKKVTARSVYIKFKLRDKKNTYILAWTTTAWTLPGNVALAVGKDISYIAAEKNRETYILAKELAGKILGGGYKIVREMKGADLVGLVYEPLFEVEGLSSESSYKVYEADFVATSEGTGVVHTAVMYGEDDYNLGTKLGLPKFHTVDGTGRFINIGKPLEGREVKKEETEDMIINMLKEKNLLFKTEDYEHDYPFCWRCETALLYYAKDSWFIKMSAINKEILANNESINWIPTHVKEGRFGQWLREGKDWAISRERYWGTALPIWKCEQCEHTEMIGSVKELEKSASGSRNTYYLMRHGVTSRHERVKEGMINNFTLERDSYHLTPEGEKEVEESLTRLQAVDSLDAIYCSPFIRTLETAKIAGRIFHLEVTADERLVEDRHALSCEGKSLKDCPIYGQPRSFETKEEGGESFNDVRQRLRSFMGEMETEHRGKKILIVSHGDPLWLLNAIAEGFTDKEIIYKSQNGELWYPTFSEVRKSNWRKIPRNEFGELDLHRPFVDAVVLKCPQCKAKMTRIPDLIDVWFDSGAMPYAQWHYPFENKKIFKKQFPADFIVEAVDQTRGWFYTLLAISTLLEKGASYKNVLVHGLVLDEKGQKMSKSKGNAVNPFEMMEKFGADAGRWYFYTTNAPEDSKLFTEKDIQSKLTGLISTIENCLRFYELYNPEIGAPLPKFNALDKWVFSKLYRLIDEVSADLDNYDVVAPARALEKFIIEDLSNWWLRRSRKRKEALPVLRYVLLESSKLLAPFMPFMAEDMHHRLKGSLESVHLEAWPKVLKKYIDDELEKEMAEVQKMVTEGLASRKEKQIKVRQPLAGVTVARAEKFARDLEKLILEELNVKKIGYAEKSDEPVVLDTELSAALVGEGYVREVMRQIQDMRKEAKYRLADKVRAHWNTKDRWLKEALMEWAEEIKKETLLSDFSHQPKANIAYDIEKEFDVAPGKKIWLGIWK